MVLSLDPNGYGSINRYRSGKTLISFNGKESGGKLLSKDGIVMKQWDANGTITLADGTTETTLNNNGDHVIAIKLEEKGRLIAKVQIQKGCQGPTIEIEFNCKNITQLFQHGPNVFPSLLPVE